MNKSNFLLFIAFLFISTSCLRDNDCDECFTPPQQLYFKVLSAENDENLYSNYTYIVSELKLYYMDGEDKIYIQISLYQNGDQWILSSNDMSWIALANTSETFYLELNPETTESIYLKIVSVTEDCCTFHPIEELKINGEEAEFEQYTNIIIIRK